ncbi:hypothetical protein D0817_23125 [Flavobacterium cupreum]|uniref:Uncharacterized protein n=1 Tax=Flavobacterium cupreum TaxID=2133766 RepID=A0A434A101_9FLAO|nr:hypothetical protein D0817_23125 [Flavobacterium cupreum]
MVAVTDFKFKNCLKRFATNLHELFSRRFKQMYTDLFYRKARKVFVAAWFGKNTSSQSWFNTKLCELCIF